jgi:fluoroquinolone transport system permease protein
MSKTTAVKAMMVLDMRLLLLDRFLLGGAAYIIAIAVALRWLWPWLASELMTSMDFDISPYASLGFSFFILVNASVLTSMIGGFLLLDTREEATIKALLVTETPLSLRLSVLAGLIIVSGFVLTVFEAAVIGIGVPPWPAVIVAALLGAPSGMVMALMLATLASNKVEALAVMKITAFMGMVPIGAYFLPEPYQFICGIIPVYWACKIWWMAAAGQAGWIWMALPGTLVTTGWLVVFWRKFTTIAYR